MNPDNNTIAAALEHVADAYSDARRSYTSSFDGILRQRAADLRQSISQEGKACFWLIKYEDPDHPDELFLDEAAARAAFEQRLVSWECSLFTQLDCGRRPWNISQKGGDEPCPPHGVQTPTHTTQPPSYQSSAGSNAAPALSDPAQGGNGCRCQEDQLSAISTALGGDPSVPVLERVKLLRDALGSVTDEKAERLALDMDHQCRDHAKWYKAVQNARKLIAQPEAQQ